MISPRTHVANTDAGRIRPTLKRLLVPCVTLVFMAGVCGCQTVPVYEQQRVSKPSMQFSQSSVFQYQSTVLSQLETGLAFSGGAQPTTCSACK